MAPPCCLFGCQISWGITHRSVLQPDISVAWWRREFGGTIAQRCLFSTGRAICETRDSQGELRSPAECLRHESPPGSQHGCLEFEAMKGRWQAMPDKGSRARCR